MDALYTVAKGAFWPWLRYGLRWTIEGADHIPCDGAAVLASNHISYLDPLTLAYVADRRDRRVRFLAKAELFEKPVLGGMLRAVHQIPVERGKAQAGHALDAAVAALRKGELVTVFPEGTISLDLQPMAAKSGTARLARAANIAVIPVGLWGTHRLMHKGRKPEFHWSVPQTAVVGEPVAVREGEHVKELSDRIMAAICVCVSRARAIYPTTAGDESAWWYRAPESAVMRSCHAGPATGGVSA